MVSPRPKAPPDVVRFWADANLAARMLLWDTDNLTMVQGLVPTLELSLKLHLQYQGEEWQRVDAQRYLTDLQRLLTLGQDQRADLTKANLIRTKPLIDAGKFEEAIDAAQEKFRLVLEVLGPQHPDYLSSLEELGDVYESSQRYEDAEHQYRTTLELVKTTLGEHHPLYIVGLNRLGEMYFTTKQYGPAENYLQQSLDEYISINRTFYIYNVLGGSFVCDPLKDLLLLYTTTKDYSKAIVLLHRWTETLGPDNPSYVENIKKLAHFYKLDGRSDEAALLINQVNPPNPTVKKDTPFFPSPHDWAPSPTPQLPVVVLSEVKAKEQQIRSVLSSPSTPQKIAEAKGEVSFVLRMRRKYQGDSWWETIDARWMSVGLRRMEVFTKEQLDSLGSSYSKFHEFEYAMTDDPFNDLVAECEIRGKLFGRDYPAYAQCLSESVSLRPQPPPDEEIRTETISRDATELLKQSLGKNHPTYAQSLGVLAELLETINGSPAEIAQLYATKMGILKSTAGNSDTYISALENAARYYENQEKYMTAEAALLEAIALYKLQPAHGKSFTATGPIDNLGALSRSLATVYGEDKEYEKSEIFYRQALNIWKNAKQTDQAFYACAENDLAEILYQDKQNIEAANTLMDSIRTSWRRWSDEFPSLSIELKQRLTRETCGYDSKDKFPPADKLFTMILRDKRINPDLGLEAALETKQLVYDAARQENDAFLANMAANPTKWLASWEEMKRLRREYQSATLQALSSENPLRELSHNPNQVERARSRLELIAEIDKRLRQDNSAYRQQARLRQITLEDVKSALRPGQALIEYITFHPYDFEKQRFKLPHYAAFILYDVSKAVQAFDLGDVREIDALVEQLRGRRSALDNFITASDSAKTDVEIGISEKAVAAASQRLSDCIWQPLVGALQTGGRVYIGAEGSLGLIPFEIFSRLDERGNLKYLVEDREIVYVGSGRDLARLAMVPKTLAQSKMAVLVGNPAFNVGTNTIAQTVAGLALSNRLSPTFPAESNSVRTILGEGSGHYRLPRDWSEDAGPALGSLISEADKKLRSLGWTTRLLTRENAVEETVENLNSPTILQIATHGVFLERPIGVWSNQFRDPFLRSMLVLAGANTWQPNSSVFYRIGPKAVDDVQARAYNMVPEQLAKSRFEVADGFLTAYEVSGMNLRNTLLVNLSACETGIGDETADGIAGLREAFLLAGSRSVTMSMWAVPAEETVREVTDFYEIWLSDARQSETIPEKRYEAFRKSQQNGLRLARESHGGYGHPFYWAGFVYFGDPGDLPPVSRESDAESSYSQ